MDKDLALAARQRTSTRSMRLLAGMQSCTLHPFILPEPFVPIDRSQRRINRLEDRIRTSDAIAGGVTEIVMSVVGNRVLETEGDARGT